MHRHRARFLRRLPPLTVATALGVGAVGGALTLSSTGCGDEAEAAAESSSTPAAAPLDPSPYDPRQSLAPMIQKVGPAVVTVDARGRGGGGGWWPGQDSAPRGMGSGFVVDAEGLVVTNHHVIDGASAVQVRLSDGRRFDAEVVGSDPATDLALLRLSGAEALPVVTLGESRTLEVGDWVVAVGNPMGLDHSATVGIISGKGRGNLGLYRDSYIDFLQTDADIAPGSSGGPLFNLRGEVVGINTAVGSGLRPGFAIPIDQAKRVVEQLRDHGEVTRGWLGVGNVPGDDERGATIGEVSEGSPADRAGLRSGDVIEALDGEPLESFEALRAHVGTKPGAEVELRVRRNDEILTLRVTLGTQPRMRGPAPAAPRGSLAPEPPSRPPSWLPFGLGEPPSPPPEPPRAESPGYGARPTLGVSARETPDGLEVVEVREGSLAQTLGLMPGDVLRQLDGHSLHRPSDVSDALARAGATVTVRFERHGAVHEVTLER